MVYAPYCKNFLQYRTLPMKKCARGQMSAGANVLSALLTSLSQNLIRLFLILTKKTASPKRGSLDCGINLFFGMNDDLVEWNIYAVFVEHIFQFAV